MMEALGEASPLSVESLVTEELIVEALREMLPQIDADTATLKLVMQKLAVRFGMGFEDLKAQWRPRIKALLPDLLELCAGGDGSLESEAEEANSNAQEEEEEEEVDLRPSRKRTTSQRNAVVDASDEEEESDGANDSEASGGEAANPEEDDEEEEDVAPAKKRRSPASNGSHTRKRASKDAAPPAKKARTVKQQDPPGLTSLKELGRAAGVLNPQLYKVLKSVDSTEEAEEILRERLHDAGIAFHGSYPTSRDISSAKRKHDKDKELEGIDTSLIITGGRSRRGAVQRISYREEKISGEEDNAGEGEEEEEDAEEEQDAEESAASDSDSSEASF